MKLQEIIMDNQEREYRYEKVLRVFLGLLSQEQLSLFYRHSDKLLPTLDSYQKMLYDTMKKLEKDDQAVYDSERSL